MSRTTQRQTPDEPPQPDYTGKVVGGDFAILRKLGQGGMGQVYVAEQISLKRKVALKVLKPELAANQTSMQRFRNEAQAVARATHANIVQIYAINESEGIHYMALEFVDGFNLREYLLKKGPPELSLALAIMRQVGAALARAAELGIVHRDIKPENILLTRKGEVKVADFGLSRCFNTDDQQPLNLTASGVSMGTPLYMSPEQVQGKTVDPRTDIYSFGVTCYHMLSGSPPFQGQTAFEVAIQHVQAHASPLHTIRPDLPADLCAMVDKMMAKNPDERYQTARDVLRELSRIKESLNVGAPPASVGLTAVAPPVPTMAPAGASLPTSPALATSGGGLGRRLFLVSFFLLSTGAALGGGIWLAVYLHNPSPQSAVAEEERLLLLEANRKTASPEAAGRARMELGFYYLDHGRLAEADTCFQRMAGDGKAPAHVQDIGQLGHALVLAQENKARDSNQAVLDLKARLAGDAARSAAVFDNRRLRVALARALERNRLQCEASKEPFPPELDRLRKPGKAAD